MKNRITLILFLSIFLLISCNETKSQSVVDLNVNEFKKHLSDDDVLLIDLRTPGEIAQGKIAGAIELDYMSVGFEKKALKLPKNKSLYIYCRSGNRSKKAGYFFSKHGYRKNYNLVGGISAWKNSGNKISIEKK